MSQTYTTFTDDRPRIANLTETECHALLRDERRRLVLDVLAERQDAVGLSEVAEAVATRQDGCDATDGETVHRIEVDLHHAHLPKMEELGALDYRPETHEVVQ